MGDLFYILQQFMATYFIFLMVLDVSEAKILYSVLLNIAYPLCFQTQTIEIVSLYFR